MARHPAKCPKCGGRVDFDSAVGDHIVCASCQARLKVPASAKSHYPTGSPTLTGQASAATDPLIGTTLGEFEIVELLGRGGMGAVYKARQASLGRMVAIKVLPQSLASDESFIERFDREARAAAAVRHPNIIEIHAVGEDRGYQYIAMEFIDGDTLSDILKREGRLQPARAVEIMRAVASALAEAHECGILHRDIKPSNILIDAKGRVKVADFGLAKHEGVDVSVTVTGQALGTPLYMPPEAARGERFDARSDLYSLGATFYHALAGRPPFEADTPALLIVKHLEGRVPPLQQVAPDCPTALCRAIHRLLRKRPAERYESADKLLEVLARIETGLRAEESTPTQTVPTTPGTARQRPPTRRKDTAHRRKAAQREQDVGGASLPRVLPKWLLAAAGALLLVLVLVLVLVLSSSSKRPTAVTPPPSPEPGTRNLEPARDTAKDERNAEIVFNNVGVCLARKDYPKAQSYLDRLRSEYGATKFAAAHAKDIAALQQQIDAYVKGSGKPKTSAAVTPKPATTTRPQPQPPKPEPAEEWTTLPNGWRVGTPVNLGSAVNSAAGETNPSVSSDGLSLLFNSDRPRGHGGQDLWMCARRTIGEPWGAPINLGPTVNTSSEEGAPCLSRDGLTIWFSSDRPGGQGISDLWMCTRRNPAQRWSAPVNPGPTMNTSSKEGSPCLSRDGLTICFSSSRPGGLGTADLWMCTRRGPAELWGTLVNLGPAVNSKAREWCPELSADGLTLLLNSDRPGGRGGSDLWMCTRRSSSEPFGEAVNLGGTVNTFDNEGGPALSTDGRTLYFQSDRYGGQGNLDLWQAPLVPPGAPLPEGPPDDDERWTEWEDLFDGKTLGRWQVVDRFATELGERGKGGNVRVSEGTMVFDAGSPATGITWRGEFPTADYEFAWEAVRLTGRNTFSDVTFPVGDSRCTLHMGGWDGSVVGLSNIDGQRAQDNTTTRRVNFENGRWYALRLQVAYGKIQAWVDQEKVVGFVTGKHKLSPISPHAFARSLLVANWETRSAIRSIRLRRLKPDAKPEAKVVPWKVYTEWPFDSAEAKRRQEETAKALGVPVEQDIDLGNGVTMTMVLIPAGEFLMGSPPTTNPDELQKLFGGNPAEYQREFPQHRVKISKPFWLGKTEVTQAQWEAIMGGNPSRFRPKPQNPVEQVSWGDCQGFLQELSAKCKRPLRLPTEAEWEYACRAGTETAFHFADNQANLLHHAWSIREAGGSTQAVRKTKPNAWGLHDTAGNVWEWCEDWFAPYDKAAQVDPKGPGAGGGRVLRGGSWGNPPRQCRSASREMGDPHAAATRNDHNGCRVCMAADATHAASRPQPGVQAPHPPTQQEEPRPAARATEADAALAKLLEPIKAEVAAWDFAGAADALARLSAPEPGTWNQEPFLSRLAVRKDEIARMAALKAKMIERINTAKPRLTKRSLGIPGIGADLVKADEQGITTARLPTGKAETIAWKDLKPDAVRRLVGYTAKSADDHLAAGILLLTLGDTEGAERHFGQAKKGGVAIDRYLDPLAEAAFAGAKALLEETRGVGTPRPQEQLAAAQAALAAIEKEYGKTAWLAAHKDEVAAARGTAEAGIAEAEAEELYRQAAKLAKEKDLWALKPLIDKLKADYADTKPVTDAARKPSFAEMAESVAKLGKFLTVRKDGKGDFKTIQAAIDAAPPNSIVEIQDNGPYEGKVSFSEQKANVTLRGREGCWPAVILPATEKGALVDVLADHVGIERIVAINLSSSYERAISVSGRDCRIRSAIIHTPEPWSYHGRALLVNPGADSACENCVFVARVQAEGGLVVSNSLWLTGDVTASGVARFENVVLRELRATAACRLRSCTVLGRLEMKSEGNVLLDCVVGQVDAGTPANRIDHCNVFAAEPFLNRAKAGRRCFGKDPQFRDPRNFDYRLKPGSPCRKRASDGGDIGCRFTPEMLEMLRLAHELRRKGIIKF